MWKNSDNQNLCPCIKQQAILYKKIARIDFTLSMLNEFTRFSSSCYFWIVFRISQIFGIILGLTLSLIPICADVGINEANFQTLRIELPVLDGNVYNDRRFITLKIW